MHINWWGREGYLNAANHRERLIRGDDVRVKLSDQRQNRIRRVSRKCLPLWTLMMFATSAGNPKSLPPPKINPFSSFTFLSLTSSSNLFLASALTNFFAKSGSTSAGAADRALLAFLIAIFSVWEEGMNCGKCRREKNKKRVSHWRGRRRVLMFCLGSVCLGTSDTKIPRLQQWGFSVPNPWEPKWVLGFGPTTKQQFIWTFQLAH